MVVFKLGVRVRVRVRDRDRVRIRILTLDGQACRSRRMSGSVRAIDKWGC